MSKKKRPNIIIPVEKTQQTKKSMFADKIIITHRAQPFHADDVFCIALAMEAGIITSQGQVIGVEEMPNLKDVKPGTMFVDIGGAYFKEIQEAGCYVYDHHGNKQYRDPINKKGRYASFGLMWRTFGGKFLRGAAFYHFDRVFASRIDAHDNGERPFAISHMIASMNPIYGSFESGDAQFWKAVHLAREILKREIAQAKVWSTMKAKAPEIIEANLDEDGNKLKEYIILREHMPIFSHIGNHPQAPAFVIYPSKRGGWNIQNISESEISFPEEWLGKTDSEELPEGCTFCHMGGFLMSAKTKDAAINAVEMAVELHHQRIKDDGILMLEINDATSGEEFDYDFEDFFTETLEKV